MGYETPSPAPHETVVAREIGPLPDPIPIYGPFVAPLNVPGPQARSWERNLFFPLDIPGGGLGSRASSRDFSTERADQPRQKVPF